MESLRIAWLNQFDPLHPWAGGAERHIDEVSRCLAKAGHQVTIFSERFGESLSTESRFGVQIERPGGRIGVHLWAATNLRASREFDIVIQDLSKVLPWGTAKTWRVPCLAIVRHLNGWILMQEVPASAPILWTAERLYGRVLRAVPIVTEANSTIRRLTLIGVPPESVSRVLPGVDHAIFSSDPGCRSRNPVILYAGRLKKYKRVDLAIRAFRLLLRKYPRSTMFVVGMGSDSARLKGLTEELDLNSSVSFTGKVSLKELVDYYRRAWVHVQTSSAEGWGYTVMEAAACGTPTVATAGSALEESVGPFCQTYLARCPTPEAVCHSISRCVDDMSSRAPEIERKMVEYAATFDWSKTSTAFYAEIRHALDQSQSRSSVSDEAVDTDLGGKTSSSQS